MILKRVLTRKSKFGIGKYKNYTVQQIIDMRLKLKLESAYFKLTSIDFTPDILDELKITEEFRLEKPAANRDLYYEWLKHNGLFGRERPKTFGVMKNETKPLTPKQLMGINHGR